MRYLRLLNFCSLLFLLAFGVGNVAFGQTTVTFGTNSSSSSTRGPLQRSDTNSSTVFSRFVHVYTASEMTTAGIPSGASITSLNWELASSNVIIGSGNANLKVYIKNSSAVKAVAGSWSTLIGGATLALDTNFNTTDNFPGSNGWMPFLLDSPFTYTGGALEVAVDWDCSQVSTPSFSGDGAIKWRWTSTAPDTLVVKKTSSSSASSNITDLKNERANMQIVYNAAACDPPSALYVENTTTTSTSLGWIASTNATTYDWKVVPAGAGAGATAIDSGSTPNTLDTVNGLMPFTSYDFFVTSDCGTIGSSGNAGPFAFMTLPVATNTITIGTGTSSSSTRGPLQRSDTNSSTVYSRFVQFYKPSEVAAAGLSAGDSLVALNWELASSSIIIGAGNAGIRVYIKNSNDSAAASNTWANLIAGSDLVVDDLYNTVNNFPGANGWMSFEFNQPFAYTGGAIEVAVDWDCSTVSTPAFSNDGALKWRWESTAPDDLVVKRTGSSSAPTSISDVTNERANIQMVYSLNSCAIPIGLTVSNIDSASASMSWSPSLAAAAYDWRIVLAGAGPLGVAVDSGTVTGDTNATSSALMPGTSYDFYVMGDCGLIGSSVASLPSSFTTLCGSVAATVFSATVTDVSCNGDSDGAIDITISLGVAPYDFIWNTTDTTEDLSGVAAGNYALTITDGNGCPSFDSITVTEPTAVAVSNVLVVDAECNGDNNGEVDITVIGGVGPYVFVWSNSATTEDLTGVASGSYTVTITDDNGCTNVDNAQVNEPTALSVSGSAISDTNNASVGSVSITVSGGTPPYAYSWGGTAGSSDSTGLAVGTYTVVVTDSNGCTSSVDVDVDNVVGISAIHGGGEFSIAPNPTQGVTNLALTLNSPENLLVSVYSITGELVKTYQAGKVSQWRKAIDLSTYGEGLYFVHLNIGDQTFTHKIILIN